MTIGSGSVILCMLLLVLSCAQPGGGDPNGGGGDITDILNDLLADPMDSHSDSETSPTFTPTPTPSANSVAVPVLDPPSGTTIPSEGLSITITCATVGATIRYTTDGSVPSATVGTVYSQAIAITSNTTIKVLAIKTGMADSAVVTATYTKSGEDTANLKKWEFTIGSWIRSSPAVASDGTIYIGSDDKYLYALNPDGTFKWRFATGDYVCSSPAVGPDGTIFVGSYDKNLYALNPDGSQKWAFTAGGSIYSSPAVASDGTVYFGTGEGDMKLYAVNPDGSKKWEFATGGEVQSSPSIGSDDTIFVGSDDGKLYAINPDGSKKWEFAAGARIFSSPCVGRTGTVYVGCADQKVYVIGPDGTKKWEFTTGGKIYSSCVLAADGSVYVGCDDGKLYAINSDGTSKWEFAAAGKIWSTPAVATTGVIYVGSNDRKLHAVNPDGTIKWEFVTDGRIYSSPTIVSDGTVYFGSNDGKVYALYGSGSLANSNWPRFKYRLRSNSHSTVSVPDVAKETIPVAGGKLTLKDGAEVEFPESFALADTPVTFTKLYAASGECVGTWKVVTGQYQLDISNPELVQSDLRITLPVVQGLMANLGDEFVLQAYDSSSGQWKPVSTMGYYDSTTGKVCFIFSPTDLSTVSQTTAKRVAKDAPSVRKISLRTVGDREDAEARYQNVLNMPNSKFCIHYYDAATFPGEAPKSDADWTGSGTYDKTDTVSNYLEDLDKALNDIYPKLLAVKKNTGNALFTKLTEPQKVYVENTGDDAGCSKLNGPLRISNSRIGNTKKAGQLLTEYDDMLLTAGHELVHVFQGQYYMLSGLVTGTWNRWFIEAVATYYSACLSGISDEKKGELFGGQDGKPRDYLNCPINTNSDQSYYALAHFFDWMATKSSFKKDSLIADAISSGTSDFSNLSQAIVWAGKADGISGALDEFARYLITHPEGYGKFNRAVVDQLTEYNIDPNRAFLDRVTFNDTYTFARLKRSLYATAMTAASLTGNNKTDALLVIDSTGTSGGTLKSCTYDFVARTDAGYSGKKPVDDGLTFPYSKPVTIENFGSAGTSKTKEMEQLIANINTSSTASIDVAYYLLVAPSPQVSGNTVTWSTASVAKIPREYFNADDAYEIYDPNWAKLNTQAIGLPAAGATEQNYVLADAPSGTVHVVVKDKYGNRWPKVMAEVEISISPTEVWVSQGTGSPVTFTATVSGFDPGVTWSIQESSGGTISDQGVYNPSSALPGDYHIVATSKADPTKSATAIVHVTGYKQFDQAKSETQTGWEGVGDCYPGEALGSFYFSASVNGSILVPIAGAVEPEVILEDFYFCYNKIRHVDRTRPIIISGTLSATLASNPFDCPILECGIGFLGDFYRYTLTKTRFVQREIIDGMTKSESEITGSYSFNLTDPDKGTVSHHLRYEIAVFFDFIRDGYVKLWDGYKKVETESVTSDEFLIFVAETD